jgi:ABC-type nickel/cobalt efflux system permease component RcnA
MVFVFTHGTIDYRILAIVLLFAFLAGSLHALTPGHGKSMMAAFLIGKGRNQIIDVIVLALSITFAHTFVIYILGFLLMFLSKQLPVNSAIPYFGKASAIAVAFLALSLIYKGWKNYKHEWDHKHHHDHSHDHSHCSLVKDDKKGNALIKLFLAGASGGLTPCVDALALLLLATSINQICFGLLIVFVFSLGLAGSIIIIGLLVVFGKHMLNLEKRIGRFAEIYSPIIAGLFILFLSITIFLNYS